MREWKRRSMHEHRPVARMRQEIPTEQPAPSPASPEGHTLVHVFTVASSADFLRGQAAYMVAHGFDVHAVAAPDGDTLARFAQTEGIKWEEVPMTRAMTPVQDARSLFRLCRILRKVRPDIVQAGTPKGGFLGIVAATLTGVPVRLYHMHGIRGMTARGWRRRLLLMTELLSCRLATRVLCVSQSTRNSAIAAHLCPPDKIVVLGAGSCNGVDARGRFDPQSISEQLRRDLRQRLNLPADSPVVGFVGRVARDKGIVELAEAWTTLAHDFPALHLVIVGPTEAHDPVPAATVSALRGHPRVRFVPNVADPAPHYAIMDVVALPTYREGLPNVPLEAAAMRLPVVATRVTGCVDAIVDGVTGTLVPAGSAPALSEALAAYLRSPELRSRHGSAGRTRVLADFVPQTVWRGVLDMYRAELATVAAALRGR